MIKKRCWYIALFGGWWLVVDETLDMRYWESAPSVQGPVVGDRLTFDLVVRQQDSNNHHNQNYYCYCYYFATTSTSSAACTTSTTSATTLKIRFELQTHLCVTKCHPYLVGDDSFFWVGWLVSMISTHPTVKGHINQFQVAPEPYKSSMLGWRSTCAVKVFVEYFKISRTQATLWLAQLSCINREDLHHIRKLQVTW